MNRKQSIFIVLLLLSIGYVPALVFAQEPELSDLPQLNDDASKPVVEQPKVVEETKPVAEVPAVEQLKSVEEAKPVVEAPAVEQPKVVEETKSVAEVPTAVQPKVVKNQNSATSSTTRIEKAKTAQKKSSTVKVVPKKEAAEVVTSDKPSKVSTFFMPIKDGFKKLFTKSSVATANSISKSEPSKNKKAIDTKLSTATPRKPSKLTVFFTPVTTGVKKFFTTPFSSTANLTDHGPLIQKNKSIDSYADQTGKGVTTNSFAESFKRMLIKPEQNYISFTLSPFIGVRTFGSNLGNSSDLGATILYPLKDNWYLLGSYSYSHSFSGNSLNGVHIFDYGIYAVPYAIPKYNLTLFTDVFLSRDSYSESTHLNLGYGLRYSFKTDVNTVANVEQSLGWSSHTKLGIERNVVIPKDTLKKFSENVKSTVDSVHLPKMDLSRFKLRTSTSNRTKDEAKPASSSSKRS